MDNKAYEKYRAEHPTTNHVAVEKAEFDPFDDHISTSEMILCGVIALVLVMALGQLFFRKKE
jgi:hypothetical protein